MSSISVGVRRIAVPETADDGFEDLRQVFRARMARERMYFTTASAALARAPENPAPIYKDLYDRAHRLHGGAVIFDFAAVVAAAGALEQAALLASTAQGDNADPAVWETLVFLVEVMGLQGGDRASPGSTPPLHV